MANETVKDVKKRIDTTADNIDSILNGGFDANIVKSNNTLINQIRKAISEQGIFSKEQTGLSLLTLLNNGLIENKSVKGPDGKVENKKLINLDNLLNNTENSTALNAILANESSRIELYRDYQRIYDLIPQMAIAVDRYVDNITAPDDLTKIGINMVYENEQLNEQEKYEVTNDLKRLNDKYELDKKCSKILKESLIKGDCFYAVISVRDRVNAILTESDEDGVVEADNSNKILLEETFFRKDVEDFINNRFNSIERQLRSLNEKSEEYKEKHNKLVQSRNKSMQIYNQLATIVTEKINDNVHIGSTDDILQENSSLVQSYLNIDNPTLGSQKTPSISVASSNNTYKGNKDAQKRINNFSIFSEPRDKNSPTSSEDLKIKGSVLKRLEPERVVKLERDGTEFGYLYFENFEDTYFLNNISYESDVKVFDKVFGKINTRDDLDKKNLIYNMFIKGISEKINKKSLMKFPEFASAICKFLDMDQIIQKQIRITYFRPEEVVHFGNDDNDECYHDSLYRRILFTAKMYLSMLTTSLLYKLVRAPSKRIFYIEVGLDNDDGEAVSSFVRDLKTKELKFNDIAGSSINNVLSLVSCFNDIYVPVVDNAKPIEVETAQEDSPNMDNELTEKFMKDMTSGTGIPHAFINDSENVQFAKSLAMENLAFMRRVVVYQAIYSRQFTKLLRALYTNEYPEKLLQNSKKLKDNNKAEMEKSSVIIDIDYLKVIFPCPTTLNMSVANEQTGVVTTIAEFIIKSLLGEPPQNAVPGDDSYELTKNALFKLIVRKYLPNIDWKDFDELFNKAKIEATRTKVKTDATTVDTEIDANDSYS